MVLTEEIGVIYVPLKPRIPISFQNKTTYAVGGCPNSLFLFCNTFFLCFKEKSISVSIIVLLYIIILIVHLNKWVYKLFVQLNTYSAQLNIST